MGDQNQPIELHPCERVFGKCTATGECRYKDAPRDACLAFLKNRCKFGERCNEPHYALNKRDNCYISAFHPCVRVFGECRFGDSCEYAKYPSNTCIRFLKGRCNMADRCEEVHIQGGIAGGGGQQQQQHGYDPMTGGMAAMYGAGAQGQGAPGAAVAAGYAAMGYPGYAYPGYNPYMDQMAAGQMAGGRKRGRDEGGMGGMGGPGKRQAGGPGQLHPCVRVFGHCRHGQNCRYARMPFAACLQHLKGSCRFGDRCNEEHVALSKSDGKHPCVRIYGYCRDGDACRWKDIPEDRCLQFLRGVCKFGDRCREVHEQPQQQDAGGSYQSYDDQQQ